MMDIIACSPDSAHYLIDDVLRWGAALIVGAKDLRNSYDFGAPTSTPQSGQKNMSDHSLPVAIPSEKTASSIASKIQHPSMNQMRSGTLPFTKISAEQALEQSWREFAVTHKDTAGQKRKEREAKERRQDEKRASAVRRQRECRHQQKLNVA
jgi:hypothetical protein